ncbi:MAG: 3-hydroxyacyl-CoA dehydrogenase NAD-binding domain-containing protein [Longimicrobiales bacterium]
MSSSLPEAAAAVALEIGADGVATLTLDNPDKPHNILHSTVMARLDALLGEVEQAAAGGRVRALVVRSNKPGSFVAGADVHEIAAITDATEGEEKAALGQAVFQRLAELPVPTVAAVNGICLGGGTELILACDRRIAADDPAVKIGLPEVRLGILPAFGGTTRLPRLIGVAAATQLIVTGRTVDARRAERLGLIDERVPPQLLESRARSLAAELAAQPPAARRRRSSWRRRLENAAPARKAILAAARRRVRKETRGHYPAPLRALDAIDRTLGLSLEKALAVEARAVGELITTEVSKNLIHVFLLMEGAKKQAPAAEPQQVERVGVLGAGVMGGGIAQLLAYRGLHARMKDIRQEALAQGLRHAREQFDKLVERRRLRRPQADQAMERISPTLDYAGFATLDVVIEAVVERLDIKQAVLRETEAAVAADCVLATNTSSLSVTEMQQALERPGNFCGMHFFNPVHRMPLVEVVRGEHSDERALATVFALARRLEKTPLIVNDSPGFLVNRVLAPYLNEAGWLLAEGADVEAADRAMVEFGMPMGPFRLLDEVGLDVARHAGRTMHDAFGERLAPAPPLLALERTERLGRKNGRGFYRYDNGKQQGVDGSIYGELAPAVPAERRTFAPVTIQQRLLLAMINEAARVLEERVVSTAGDVDLGMITGTGFPPFRGGLLRYADTLGARTIHDRLDAFGSRYSPAALIARLAETGGTFY